MNFIVYDKAPVALVKKAEVNKGAVFGLAVGQHLIGGDGHGPDFF